MLWIGLALALVALPVLADDTIARGIDVWQTKGDGRTYVTLDLAPGFFCTNSAAWSGTVTLAGNPVATSPADVLGATDTVIERLGDATFVNNVATVNAIVRAASFKGTAPIAVSGCDGSAYWDVKSTAAPTQSPFPITIRRPSSTATGGSFDSDLTISPRLIFTQQESGLQRTLDQSQVHFSTSGAEWTHQPGAGGVTYSGSVQIDTDADGAVDTTVPGTSNFAAGWSSVAQAGCSTPPCAVPIPHQAPSHLHYVSPPPPYCKTTTTGASADTAKRGSTKAALVAQRCLSKTADPVQPVGSVQ
jgi:hypothetical protein